MTSTRSSVKEMTGASRGAQQDSSPGQCSHIHGFLILKFVKIKIPMVAQPPYSPDLSRMDFPVPRI
jgi:hypothetical protein